jgi:ATP-dependent DNA ligase
MDPNNVGYIVDKNSDRYGDLHDEIDKLVELSNDRKSFPGTHVVSLERDHFQTLQDNTEDYWVCDKSDGVRYLMCISANRMVYLINRRYDIRSTNVAFESRAVLGAEALHISRSVLDGELVWDTKKKAFVFMLFDVLVIRGKSVGGMHLPERLSFIQSDVIGKQILSPNVFTPTFTIAIKQFRKLKHLDYVIKKDIPALSYRCDGVIFTPSAAPYIYGVNRQLFKWKTRHTVDFEIDWMSRKRINGTSVFVFLLFLYDKGRRMTSTNMILQFDGEEDAKYSTDPNVHFMVNGKKAIVECYYDPTKRVYIPNEYDALRYDGGRTVTGGWVFVGIRNDKATANDTNTYESIMKEDIIVEDELLGALMVKKQKI